MTIGRILQIFRVINNYSTKQLAELLNVSQAFITDLENGKKTPSLETTNQIAKAFNVSPSTILRIHEFSEKNNGDFNKTLLEVVKIYVSE